MTRHKVLANVSTKFWGRVMSACLLFVAIGCTFGAPEQESTTSASVSPDLPPGTLGMTTVMRGELESLLSGDVLTRYKGLPEEYREALRGYLAFGVSPELIPALVEQKMAQWPSPPPPLKELIGQDRVEAIEEIIEDQIREPVSKTLPYASFLLNYYIYALGAYDTAAEQRASLAALADSRYGGRDQTKREALAAPQHGASQSEIEALADPQHGAVNQANQVPMPKPELTSIIAPVALARLGELGPNFRRMVEAKDGNWLPQEPASIAFYLLHAEIGLLKAEPGLELPPIESSLTQEQLSEFRALTPIVQERVKQSFHAAIFAHLISSALYATSPALSLPPTESLSAIASSELDLGKIF